MLRVLPPSGSPIRPSELAGWLLALAAGRDRTPELLEAFHATAGVRHCFPLSTGRAAMCFLFRCLRKYCGDDRRNEVLVPGYTCYSVASSAIMAGLKVRICDIDPDTLSYDPERLRSVDFSRVLCMVTANLYGLPDDLRLIERIAADNDVYLVDDAAQCLGALVEGRPSGTFGTAGLFSLDKGKNITSLQGGMIVSNDDDFAALVRQEYRSLAQNATADNLRDYIKVLVYFFFLHPAMYWIPASLPFLKLGETRYEDDYPLHAYPAGLAPLALLQLRRYPAILAARTLAASRYQQRLPRHDHLRPVQPVPGTQPAWLRFPLRITSPRLRERFLAINGRMGCTASYPKPIVDIPEIRDRIAIDSGCCDNARLVAGEIVTLPTHRLVRDRDITAICRSLETLLAGQS